MRFPGASVLVLADGLLPDAVLRRCGVRGWWLLGHAAARWQPGSQLGDETDDSLQRHTHRPPHQHWRAPEAGCHCRRLQHRQPLQRCRREPALLLDLVHGGNPERSVRSAATAVRIEAELVTSPNMTRAPG